MKEKVTVLIADDNQEFSKTLSSYLESQQDMEVIGMAKDGNEAIEMITNTSTRCCIIRCYNATFRWIRSFGKC